MKNYSNTTEAAFNYLNSNYGFDGKFNSRSVGYTSTHRFESTSATCACGESEAINVYDDQTNECIQTIIICEFCFENATHHEQI